MTGCFGSSFSHIHANLNELVTAPLRSPTPSRSISRLPTCRSSTTRSTLLASAATPPLRSSPAEGASALSERYDHQVRLEAVAGELIYVLVPDTEKAPTEHIGTLRGEYLEDMLDNIEARLEHEQNKLGLTANTTPAPKSVLARDAQKNCFDATFCILTWQCIQVDSSCAGCAIFFCTKK